MSDLSRRLEQLSPDIQAVLEENHFDRARFLSLADRLRRSEQVDNRVTGRVLPPEPGDIVTHPAQSSAEAAEYRQVGLEALRRGECAFVLLAGGMATRMGSVVKALVEALPGRSFLELRLAEQQALERRFGRRAPLYLMTSYATHRDIRRALGKRLDGSSVAVFPQHVSLRLTPEADLYLDPAGEPSLHAHGHGDFLDAFRQSGLLQRFLDQGGRTVMVTNLDNLGAYPDPAILGYHLSHRAPCTAEVVDKVGSDRGGIPVRLDGKPVVLEEFRLPGSFDPSTVSVFNVNTFWFDAHELSALDLEWTYFLVEKKVEEDRVIQFERLINELTFALETRYVRVPRAGADARFLPVKDFAELEARQVEIRAALSARGVVGND